MKSPTITTTINTNLHKYIATPLKAVTQEHYLVEFELGFKLKTTRLMRIEKSLEIGRPVKILSELIDDDVAEFKGTLAEGPGADFYNYRAYCVYVVDGDTVIVDIDCGFGIKLTNQRLRLAGVNTPELPERDGLRALSWMRDRVQEREVYIQSVQAGDLGLKPDRYGRYLGYLFHGGVNLNTKLIELGLGEAYMGRSRTRELKPPILRN